ncbi:hypothetical protein [Chondrinema litorale]|uniref:hypothetical protein n=1 Tax=Chondrinema litorale TaxID=2994555 RepID=UPI002543460F|nr:hypothetical protein [Chondrinema litorale]UZR95151.1 hypothetical protein OQ292_04885 [Chondrinema litorale]
MRSLNLALQVNKRALPLIIVLFAVCSQLFAQSQEVLFFPDSRSTRIKSMEINADLVKYQVANDQLGQFYNILKSDIMMAIYPLGTYHVYSDAKKDLVSVAYASGTNNKIDKLVTKEKKVIAANITDINMGKVNYKDLKSGNPASVNTSNLYMILYKDGKYQMYAAADEVAKALNVVSDEIKGMDNSLATGNFQNVSLNTNSGSTTTTTNTGSTGDNILDEGMPNVKKEEFEEKALAKTKELEDYLRLIANKNTKFQKANEAIDAAVKLFIDANRVMEVSSKNRSVVKKYEIRTYFEKLKLLKYDDVRVSWSDISYVSNIRKGEDGNYYGIVTLQQKFEGFIDGALVYTDVTKKNMTVILKTYDKYVVGEKQTLWDVYLGDIGVVQTE